MTLTAQSEQTRAELVANARDLQPLLRKHVADGEVYRRQSDEVIEALTAAATPAQDACGEPDAYAQRPSTRSPPSTRRAGAGLALPEILTSGSGPKTSSCARSGACALTHAPPVAMPTTQAAEPSASASASVTST